MEIFGIEFENLVQIIYFLKIGGKINKKFFVSLRFYKNVYI